MKSLFSGMRPTGKLHIGHYFGVLKNWRELQDEYKCIFGAVDWHALTTSFENTDKIGENIIEMITDWLSVGLDPNKATFIIQSHVKEHAELHLILSMLTPLPWLQRNPVLKEQVRSLNLGDSFSYGLLGYPVLMAADILLYKSDIVPVGEDQVPHIEITREIARRFNYYYKEVFPLPKEKLTETPRIPGTDGKEKMSKSLGNHILISEPKESLEKKVMSMVTDPQKIRLKDPGHPEVCTVFYFHKMFNKEEVPQIEEDCKKGTLGCVACKRNLAKKIYEFFAPIREKREEYEKDPSLVMDILKEGEKRAREIASRTMEEVREAMKMSY